MYFVTNDRAAAVRAAVLCSLSRGYPRDSAAPLAVEGEPYGPRFYVAIGQWRDLIAAGVDGVQPLSPSELVEARTFVELAVSDIPLDWAIEPPTDDVLE